MDPTYITIRCGLCEDAIVHMYCDLCRVNLCISCIGKHVSDDYDKHKVVPFQQRNSTLIYPNCTIHQTKNCKFYCKECDISVCSLCCIISDTHKGHTISLVSDIYNSKLEVINKDTDEIKNIIFPTYEEIVADIETQMANLDGEYEKLATAVTERGKECNIVINTIVDQMKAEIEEQKWQHMSILQIHLNEIKQIQSRIDKTLLYLNRIEESNEVSLTMDYISQIQEFSNLPPKVHVSLPTFFPKTTDTDNFCMLFGSLTPLSKGEKENGYTLKTSTKELLKEPKIYTIINTGYDNLLGVTCFGAGIWTRAFKVSDLKCYNIHGSLIKTIQTKSGRMPNDIAMTNDGDLLYSDWSNGTVCKVSNEQIEEVIRLQGWTPINLCVTSSGDLLVTMCSDDKNKSKVVRFSGLQETQAIQFDDKGEPLYSGKHGIKYICENRNLDICVADKDVGALVIVNHSGKLRFRYTGDPSTPKKNNSFVPYGIATDSLSQILTTDRDNNCIHILDKDGQFLKIINYDLKFPCGLCVDKRDNLFVTENRSGHVKKIQYLK